MHECPCCGECVYSDDADDLCSCCIEASCEAHDCSSHTGTSHDIDGVYVDCQIPQCPACETRSTFCTDGKWHSNCDDEKACEAEYARQNA